MLTVSHPPFAVVVHAVEAVPLCVELGEGVSHLCNLSLRRLQDGIRLALMDHRYLLPDTLQTLLYTLGEREGQEREREERREEGET